MDKIAVLDFGGQYAHLIANRVRRLGVFSEIFDGETPAESLKGYKGIIFSGGPQSVYEHDSVKCDPKVLDLGVPILGICYGHQLLAYVQGAKVEPAHVREFGLTEMEVVKAEGVFKGLAAKETVWMSHGDSVKELPPGYEVIGQSPGEHAAIANFEKNFYGFQFHVEVVHTVHGMQILKNFLDICRVAFTWKIDDFIAQEIASIQKQVGDKKVFLMVSGGVDSTVAFALLEKALGPDRVYGLFVDTGFLRMNEREQVGTALKNLGFANLHIRDESSRYFASLKDKYDPEAKRKIIGDLFLEVQQDVANELNLNPEEWILGQGTIYPDTIETGGTRHAAKIKTHHNRVPQIEELMKQGKIIEPLAQLYKDEVREVGEKLGLPEAMVWRHPFPGPGLAVRCLCAQEEKYPDHHMIAEKKIDEILKPYNLTGKILPIQSVGVQGDYRTYRHPLAIMGHCDFDVLDKLATRLINEFKEINRVVLTLAPNKIETQKVQKVYLTPERIQLLQQADAKVSDFLVQEKLQRDIWQFPTVLLPLAVNRESGESVVLRPVSSEEAMTASFYRMDLQRLQKLADSIYEIPGITAVFYDVTNKPPGTIEWE
ncbi:MAG: glutamine-hydrolyzing GMP synthase [Candidatus Gracilibacteria bacterium]